MKEFQQQITNLLQDNLKLNNKLAINTYRSVLTAISNYEKANPGKEWTQIDILQPLAKSRQQSIDAYKTANRPDLAADEQVELDIINQFLPKNLSVDEIKAAIDQIISNLGLVAITQQSMGLILKEFKIKHPGQDMKTASEWIKTKI